MAYGDKHFLAPRAAFQRQQPTPSPVEFEYSLRVTLLRRQVKRMGEHISDRRFKDIIVQGLATDYREVKVMAYRDSKMHHAVHVLGRHFKPQRKRQGNRQAWSGCSSGISTRHRPYNVLQLQRERALHEYCPALANTKRRRNSSDGRQRKDKVEPGAVPDRSGAPSIIQQPITKPTVAHRESRTNRQVKRTPQLPCSAQHLLLTASRRTWASTADSCESLRLVNRDHHRQQPIAHGPG